MKNQEYEITRVIYNWKSIKDFQEWKVGKKGVKKIIYIPVPESVEVLFDYGAIATFHNINQIDLKPVNEPEPPLEITRGEAEKLQLSIAKILVLIDWLKKYDLVPSAIAADTWDMLRKAPENLRKAAECLLPKGD